MCDNHRNRKESDRRVVGGLLAIVYALAAIGLVAEYRLIYLALDYLGIAGVLLLVLAGLWLITTAAEYFAGEGLDK